MESEILLCLLPIHWAQFGGGGGECHWNEVTIWICFWASFFACFFISGIVSLSSPAQDKDGKREKERGNPHAWFSLPAPWVYELRYNKILP